MGNAHTFTHLRITCNRWLPDTHPDHYQALCGAKWYGLTLSPNKGDVTCQACKAEYKKLQESVTDVLKVISDSMIKSEIKSDTEAGKKAGA